MPIDGETSRPLFSHPRHQVSPITGRVADRRGRWWLGRILLLWVSAMFGQSGQVLGIDVDGRLQANAQGSGMQAPAGPDGRLAVGANVRGAELLIEGRPGVAAPCPLDVDGSDVVDDSPQVDFSAWLEEFKRMAITCGVSSQTVEAAFENMRHDDQVVRLDRRQPEYKSTFSEYLSNRVNNASIERGRRELRSRKALLQELYDRYGVPPEVLVSLWGLESAFGRVIGDKPIFTTLGTLVYDGRRRDFYRRELLAALRVVDAGHIEPKRMTSSWAGAMGQTQFMPTTFLRHAMDGDSDGRIDVWSSAPDALASAANYLAEIGWQPGQPWGLEVLLPAGFDAYQARLSWTLSNAQWTDLGVEAADGHSLPAMTGSGSIVLPSGIQGPAFLVYDNFRVITEWNRSIFYALSVGYLSQRLAGGSALVGKAPRGESRLSRAEVMGLQRDLNRLGFDAGTPDGMVGIRTRQAIRDYQRDQGMFADAYPTPELIEKIRKHPGIGPPTPATY